jgi:hypothetical protein
MQLNLGFDVFMRIDTMSITINCDKNLIEIKAITGYVVPVSDTDCWIGLPLFDRLSGSKYLRLNPTGVSGGRAVTKFCLGLSKAKCNQINAQVTLEAFHLEV